MARSKPQTEFHVSYGAVTLNTNADALLPVFIAPRYEIHGEPYGNATFASGAIFSSGTPLSGSWPHATSGAVIDSAHAEVYVTSPTIKLKVGTPKSAYEGGIVVFSGAVTGKNSIVSGGYSVRAGDQMLIGANTYEVLSVGPVTSGASAKLVSAGVVTSGGNWTATYSGNQSAVYVLSATDSAESGGVTMSAVAAIGDSGYHASLEFTSGAAVVVGNLGATLKATELEATDVSSGDTMVLTCVPGKEGAFAQVYLDTDSTPALSTANVLTKNFITTSAPINSAYWSGGATQVTVKSNAQCIKDGNSYPIANGGIIVNYRELLTDDVNIIMTGAEAGSWVGAQTPENPLGEMYKAATKTGYNDFLLIATAGDTDDAYEAALEVAGRQEKAYSIVELRQTPGTLAAAEAIVAKYSAPTIAQMKRLWIYSQIPSTTTVLDSTAEASGTTVTFPAADTENIIKGDIIVFPAVTDDNGIAKSGVVKSVSDGAVTVDSNLGTIGYTAVEVRRALNHTQLAQAIAEEARTYSNSRINYVYAEPNTVAGDSFEDARYILPVLATMRATMAPHAPLTDVPIPGVAIGTGVGFTESDLDLMNDAGVWICYRDGRGEMVTRHAITTGGDGTIAEEDSAVSNGDNIVRTIRNQVSWLRGNCNVTPALIDKIYVTIQAALSSIQSRNYDALIGPQILEVISVEVKQDPNNTAGVIGNLDLDLPDVYLKGDFNFNLF